MKYLKKHYKFILCLILTSMSFNLYFIFLLTNINLQLLIYLDILLCVCIGLFIGIDVYTFYRKEKEKEEYLEINDYIFNRFEEFENKDIIEHDFQIFQDRLNEQISINQDQQDFITKWCHEIKIPLATACLINEKIEEPHLKEQLKEQLEKIKQYLNSALVSCKVQGTFDDLQVKKIKLDECVNTSIKNNRYFLINNHVELQIDLHDEYVYSDSQWLIYIIDQILANAIKYTRENPRIHIWSNTTENEVKLNIKDYGEGVKDYDLPRIFERGYVGSNHHNGKYKSTGMGLYMVKLMIKKLGHDITVTSNDQEYTCFCLTFKNIENHFNL